MSSFKSAQKNDQESNHPTRIRVMMVITKADIGGAQVHVLQILRELGHQYQFILITGEEDFLTERARALDVEVVICDQLVRSITPAKDFSVITALVRLIHQYKPVFLHAHSFKAGLVARLAVKMTRVPAAFTAHGWAFTPGAPVSQVALGLMAESLLCRMCAAVITISEHDFFLARKYRVGSARSRFLIPNAGEFVGAKAKPDHSPVKLLCVGRLTPVKNQKFLLEVMQHLPEEVTLTIIGEGLERYGLEQQVINLGLRHRVSLPGEVLDIVPYLEAAQIFVLCSNYEGLPLSVLEAMSAGLPVVSTDVGGIREAVIHGESGFLVPRGDMQQMIVRLKKLIDDPDLRLNFGKRGRRHYLENYVLKRFIDQMEQFYIQMPRKKWTQT